MSGDQMWAHNWVWCKERNEPVRVAHPSYGFRYVCDDEWTDLRCPGPHHPILVDLLRVGTPPPEEPS